MKPDGRLVFIEHGSAPDCRCELGNIVSRPVETTRGRMPPEPPGQDYARPERFRCLECQEGYLSGPRPLIFTYRGIAAGSLEATTIPTGTQIEQLVRFAFNLAELARIDSGVIQVKSSNPSVNSRTG